MIPLITVLKGICETITISSDYSAGVFFTRTGHEAFIVTGNESNPEYRYEFTFTDENKDQHDEAIEQLIWHIEGEHNEHE